MARGRKSRRTALVHTHLENVSRQLLDEHPEIVREFVGRNAGIYALYRKNDLYYVGLATTLRGRLKAHGRNRHGESWDRFSIYLTVDNSYLREIEALVLRISSPVGAKQKGRLAKSRDMRRQIQREIKLKQNTQVSELFGLKRQADGKEKAADASKLLKLLPQGGHLRGELKGKLFKGKVLKSGKVRFNKTYYKSLTLAAYAAIGRPINGWWFWKVKRGGTWVRLTEIRRAGTPVYSR